MDRDLATDRDFNRVARIAHHRLGLHLPYAKKALVVARIRKKMEEIGINSISEYIDSLENDWSLSDRLGFTTSLTTNVTSFFREKHHFDLVYDAFDSEIAPKLSKGGKVRIWSAGCSSGQETYSICMTLFQKDMEVWKKDIKILATDIDPEILERARSGVYSPKEIETLPTEYINSYFIRQHGNFKVVEKIRKLTSFGILNLIDPYPMSGKFDIIFCRNVAIYFDKKIQEKVWSKIIEYLNISGILIIGHSERLPSTYEENFLPIGTTAYRYMPRKS